MSDWLARLNRELLEQTDGQAAITELAAGLSGLRESRPLAEWKEFVTAFRAHPLMSTLLEDPYTSRSYRKPRGYAGDAVLIDLIYGDGEGEELLAKATSLGRRIYRQAMREKGVAATRARRDRLAAEIDRTCSERPSADILSVACGHLRELLLSTAFQMRRTGRVIGLDQDRRSLRVAERSLGTGSVQLLAASIMQLIDGSLDPGRFDLIYAAGLFDYLDEATSRSLLTAMVRLAKPGGRILIANFVPGIRVAGYMEAAMDWWLLYRTPEQLYAVASGLPRHVRAWVMLDDFGYVAYLELQVGEPLEKRK